MRDLPQGLVAVRALFVPRVLKKKKAISARWQPSFATGAQLLHPFFLLGRTALSAQEIALIFCARARPKMSERAREASAVPLLRTARAALALLAPRRPCPPGGAEDLLQDILAEAAQRIPPRLQFLDILRSDEKADVVLMHRRSWRRLRDCCCCQEQLVNLLFLPCGHVCTCVECGQRLKTCPLCRQQISGARRLLLPLAL